MLVPQYWAQARIQKRTRNGQITVRRFGWSDISQADAQENADQRAAEAYDQIISGQNVIRSEPKVPYNGAEGVPIREEIVRRCKDSVITRNSYGALCLNTPDVLFADIDFEYSPPCGAYLYSFGAIWLATIIGGISADQSFAGIIGGFFLGLGFFYPLTAGIFKVKNILLGSPDSQARKRVNKFIAQNPDWHLRLYRTPAGFRILVMHKTFDPNEAETLNFFKAMKTDPIYVVMCRKQNCFRARISPKPWRVGVNDHMLPRPGVWPINPDRLTDRQNWVARYESAARNYASCEFIDVFGSHLIDPKAEYIRSIHDEYCRSDSHLEVA